MFFFNFGDGTHLVQMRKSLFQILSPCTLYLKISSAGKFRIYLILINVSILSSFFRPIFLKYKGNTISADLLGQQKI